MTWDVLGLGAVAVDDLIYVPHYPAPDTKVLIICEQRQGGGLTGTALVAAARLGAHAAYFGVLGTDELSRYTISELEGEGVSCAPALIRAGAGPVHATIIVDTSSGQRTILHSHAFVQERGPQEVGEEFVARTKVLFVDYTTPRSAIRACQVARQLGIPTVGDLEGIITPETIELAGLLDHLIISLSYARRFTGLQDPQEIVQALDSDRRKCVVVTDGANGGWWYAHHGPVHHYTAYTVPVVDTTGCGDVFHGVYAACLARGESVPRTIQLASAAAAIKATRAGGRSGCPTRAELTGFVSEYTSSDCGN
ncbi:MAG: PfkB family carbohydrate kinase [Anaerolineae bacterium]